MHNHVNEGRRSSYRIRHVLIAALLAPACADPGASVEPPIAEMAAATSAALTAASHAALTAASHDPVLGAPACADFSTACDAGALVVGRGPVGPEPNHPNTLTTGAACADGTSGIFHSDESVDGLRVYTADGSYLRPGATVTVEADVWAWVGFGSDALDLFHAADAADPQWQLVATLVPAAAGPSTLSAQVVLPEGDLQAVRAQLRYFGDATPCSAGSFNDRDDLAFAVGEPDTTPPAVAITSHIDGDRAKGRVLLAAAASDDVGVTSVELSVDGALVGTATAPPYRALWDTTGVSDGAHVVEVVARDAAGNTSADSVAVTVHNGDGEGNALHDAALLAPGCRAVGSECDAGGLVLGRGPNAGPEPNEPNTINDSCPDGTFGVFRSGEQLDRIRVYSASGQPMAAGALVTVEAEVWAAWGDFEDDYLDLYHAADATDPSWTYLGTLQPEDEGTQVLSLTFTLPAGGLQAVRGVFRWVGLSPQPCDPRGWTDHDDLVFAVD